jgi:hypothetical protein
LTTIFGNAFLKCFKSQEDRTRQRKYISAK